MASVLIHVRDAAVVVYRYCTNEILMRHSFSYQTNYIVPPSTWWWMNVYIDHVREVFFFKFDEWNIIFEFILFWIYHSVEFATNFGKNIHNLIIIESFCSHFEAQSHFNSFMFMNENIWILTNRQNKTDRNWANTLFVEFVVAYLKWYTKTYHTFEYTVLY